MVKIISLKHESLRTLEEKLGYAFNDKGKLQQACHRKKAQAMEANRAFERLEFLGDRVLGLAVADLLFNEKRTVSEGVLAKHFSTLVSKECCAQVALSIDLPSYLDHKKGDGVQGHDLNLALAHSHAFSDSMEAVLGAIYLDSHFDAAKDVIARLWAPLLEGDVSAPKDQKTLLQEYSQQRYQIIPDYEVIERSGPDHAPFFTMKVSVKGKGSAEGRGATKRHAEQEAANAFLENNPEFLAWQKKKESVAPQKHSKKKTLIISANTTLKRKKTNTSYKRIS